MAVWSVSGYFVWPSKGTFGDFGGQQSRSKLKALLCGIYSFALVESFDSVYASQSTSFTRF
jgi:hypothetical protein